KTAMVIAAERPTLPSTIAVSAGTLPRADYLRMRHGGLYESWEYTNEHLGSDARILAGPMTSFAHGATYYCDRVCYATDAQIQFAIRLDTWEHFLQDLKRERIDYLLAQAPFVFERPSLDYTPADNEEPFVERLAEEYGEPLFTSGYFTLYRLDNL